MGNPVKARTFNQYLATRPAIFHCMISSYHDLTSPVFDLQLMLKLSEYPPAFSALLTIFYRGAGDFPHLLLGISHMYISASMCFVKSEILNPKISMIYSCYNKCSKCYIIMHSILAKHLNLSFTWFISHASISCWDQHSYSGNYQVVS
jgi:hypothetical protein